MCGGPEVTNYQADAFYPVLSLAVNWRDLTTGGLTFSPVHFGNIILIFFHAPHRRYSRR